MSDKMKHARYEMLKQLSKKKSSEMNEPSIGKSLKSKKLKKVEVVADTDENLKKGLSKAQQILKAKLGKLLDEDASEEEETEEACEHCEDEGCEHCEEEAEETEEE